jgi:hypothetical protein
VICDDGWPGWRHSTNLSRHSLMSVPGQLMTARCRHQSSFQSECNLSLNLFHKWSDQLPWANLNGQEPNLFSASDWRDVFAVVLVIPHAVDARQRCFFRTRRVWDATNSQARVNRLLEGWKRASILGRKQGRYLISTLISPRWLVLPLGA